MHDTEKTLFFNTHNLNEEVECNMSKSMSLSILAQK